MSHKHKLQDGRETGKEQIEANPAKHFHMLDGDKTSSEDFDEKHTHTINGEITGPPIEIEGKEMPVKRKTKYLGGVITKFAVEDRPEGQFGLVSGYPATFDLDRGDWTGVKDQFTPGAFLDSIADHLKRRRAVRFKDHHGRTVGKAPIEGMREDDRGLFGTAEINLEVQQGAELYSLIKQGAISDFSIGFSIDEFTLDNDIRTITKATIWEFSAVDEPMNPHAVITDVKAVVPFQDLPLAERDKPWDVSAALKRVSELTNSEDTPDVQYKKAFVWYDRENDNTFAAYKLPVADVIDGKLTVIPRAVFAAASDLSGVSESDKPGVIRHLEKYYAKMDIESPFKGDDKQYFTEAQVKELTPRELEKALRRSGAFSKKAAKVLVSRLDKPELTNDNDYSELLKSIKSIKL